MTPNSAVSHNRYGSVRDCTGELDTEDKGAESYDDYSIRNDVSGLMWGVRLHLLDHARQHKKLTLAPLEF